MNWGLTAWNDIIGVQRETKKLEKALDHKPDTIIEFRKALEKGQLAFIRAVNDHMKDAVK